MERQNAKEWDGFSQQMKQILSDLQNGSVDAFIVWMENERKLILPDVQCLNYHGWSTVFVMAGGALMGLVRSPR